MKNKKITRKYLMKGKKHDSIPANHYGCWILPCQVMADLTIKLALLTLFVAVNGSKWQLLTVKKLKKIMVKKLSDTYMLPFHNYSKFLMFAFQFHFETVTIVK
ncbi:hypothetical protein KKB18_11110 [bacterium]|nr:hypothetical protein [bacterium]